MAKRLHLGQNFNIFFFSVFHFLYFLPLNQYYTYSLIYSSFLALLTILHPAFRQIASLKKQKNFRMVESVFPLKKYMFCTCSNTSIVVCLRHWCLAKLGLFSLVILFKPVTALWFGGGDRLVRVLLFDQYAIFSAFYYFGFPRLLIM